MASELIGHRRCPLCGAAARLGLMKTGLTCLTCNGCNTQTFARSGRSDELLRDLQVIEPAKKPAPVVQPAQAAQAAEPVRTEKTPQATPKPAPVPTPTPTPKAAPAAEPEAPTWGWEAWK